ncbi:NADH-quinone oxidoreductase subunit L [Desulfonema ishimotonii]|uniref:NADH-quinone oxidoreductase subunit L n=1 Tax=Desulfonema ishimotonii TaxID=45657 RepID=A0A401G062_9BACT|nr:NADH-quinone oxidoreductase subunit L [Desulfonema ishimotonii]
MYTGQWLVSGDITVPIGVLLDPLSLLMLTIVTVICFLVQIYSIGYMAGDPGFSGYYAFMSLFAWAMISLTLSPTLLQLYVFWELVGLSSYLLIGFWFEKFSAGEAGKKAFVMTRLGDVAFFLGLLVLLISLGNLNISEINSPVVTEKMPSALITLSALLIFGGVIGKSAQFPLMTWLPDAMEGPTPVSALLHSATMVAAGVYLFARIFPFFSLSPTAMTVCLAVGTLSMLMASTMAMVSRDIKQVWAYSTISQLGFMIMGLGAGSYFSGVFHLTTHAGFKALLFLCAGVFIHAHDTNDMFEISQRGGRTLKTPMICMTIAAAALSGIPPFSGFFSKEAILGALAGLENPLWVWAGLLGAFLTAYYTFRLIFIILFPKSTESPAAGGHHDHENGGYRVMSWPLITLAAITVILGFGQGALEGFLAFGQSHEGGHHSWLLYTALGMTGFGVLLAWLEFGRRSASQTGFAERIPALRHLFAERWYMDRFYRWFLDRIIYKGISETCMNNDNRVIDGGVDGLARGTVGTGRMLARLHLGMIQYKLMVMFAVVFLLALYFLF